MRGWLSMDSASTVTLEFDFVQSGLATMFGGGSMSPSLSLRLIRSWFREALLARDNARRWRASTAAIALAGLNSRSAANAGVRHISSDSGSGLWYSTSGVATLSQRVRIG